MFSVVRSSTFADLNVTVWSGLSPATIARRSRLLSSPRRAARHSLIEIDAVHVKSLKQVNFCRPCEWRSHHSGAWQVGIRYAHADVNDADINGGIRDGVTIGVTIGVT